MHMCVSVCLLGRVIWTGGGPCALVPICCMGGVCGKSKLISHSQPPLLPDPREASRQEAITPNTGGSSDRPSLLSKSRSAFRTVSVAGQGPCVRGTT